MRRVNWRRKERLLTLSIDLVKRHDVFRCSALQGKDWTNIGEREVRASGNKDELCKLLFGSKPVEAEVGKKNCRRWGGREDCVCVWMDMKNRSCERLNMEGSTPLRARSRKGNFPT